ncbi:hypothetical protein Ae201684P_004493 [Aphanomyces euteiches]|nr:hypothetical protein Ae201684P_004493 [Aphanomyces euteiches]
MNVYFSDQLVGQEIVVVIERDVQDTPLPFRLGDHHNVDMVGPDGIECERHHLTLERTRCFLRALDLHHNVRIASTGAKETSVWGQINGTLEMNPNLLLSIHAFGVCAVVK